MGDRKLVKALYTLPMTFWEKRKSRAEEVRRAKAGKRRWRDMKYYSYL
jgi:hypothetical protein